MSLSANSTSPATTSRPKRAAADSRIWLGPWGLTILFIATILVRWFFAAVRQLVEDESYYWVWSRHLALSYVDHPPMVAYLIRLGTNVAGINEFGVRWPMAILAVGMPLILYFVFRKMNPDRRGASFVAVSLLVCPLISVLGLLATIDTPACFFQTAGLACAVLIFLPNRAGKSAMLPWIGFGIFQGLAMDSKYTSVLLGVSVLIAMLWSREGRGQLCTLGPWVAAVVAIVVFSPVIYFNATHHWISFRFQIDHGLGPTHATFFQKLGYFADYLGAQLAIATPVILGIFVWVMGVYWMRRGLPAHLKIILIAGTFPLVFFAFTSLHKRGNGNWPIFAYFPLTLLAAQYLSENWAGRRANIATFGVKVALISTILIHLPELFMPAGIGNPQWFRIFGWRELAQKVDPLRQGSPVYTTDYEYASELSFYLPDHPLIWPVRAERPTIFDQLPGYQPPGAFDRIVLVRLEHKTDQADLAANLFKDNFNHVQTIEWDFSKYGHLIRTSLISVYTK
jgi:4-amino-4-deoxy-L-arabinose transferase-like glycosyltransferase